MRLTTARFAILGLVATAFNTPVTIAQVDFYKAKCKECGAEVADGIREEIIHYSTCKYAPDYTPRDYDAEMEEIQRREADERRRIEERYQAHRADRARRLEDVKRAEARRTAEAARRAQQQMLNAMNEATRHGTYRGRISQRDRADLAAADRLNMSLTYYRSLTSTERKVAEVYGKKPVLPVVSSVEIADRSYTRLTQPIALFSGDFIRSVGQRVNKQLSRHSASGSVWRGTPSNAPRVGQRGYWSVTVYGSSGDAGGEAIHLLAPTGASASSSSPPAADLYERPADLASPGSSPATPSPVSLLRDDPTDSTADATAPLMSTDEIDRMVDRWKREEQQRIRELYRQVDRIYEDPLYIPTPGGALE